MTLISGDIVDIDLGLPEGHEAGFTHSAVLVTAQRILDENPAVVHVVPLTSTLRGYESEVRVEPDPANGLTETSVVQCQHVRAVSIRRIDVVRGNIGATHLTQVRETLAVLLDLP